MSRFDASHGLFQTTVASAKVANFVTPIHRAVEALAHSIGLIGKVYQIAPLYFADSLKVTTETLANPFCASVRTARYQPARSASGWA